jgi:16S rRNA U516 pseudouridylate synthase RsuA-like enzyme
MRSKRGASTNRLTYAVFTDGEAQALRAIVARCGGKMGALRRLRVGENTLEAGLYQSRMLPATKARLLDAMAREVTP